MLDRATQSDKPLSPDEALRQKAAYGMMDPLRQAREKYGQEVFDRSLSRKGVDDSTITSLNEALNKYENVRMNELRSLIAGERHGTAQSGIRGAVNKLFDGDLGQLGWGMFNLQPIWRMTGGQVQAHMEDYDKYAADQQQEFDYGVDYIECANCIFLRAENAFELAPYVCATDKPISELLGWGLTRPKTIAEGFPTCSFRFKKGGATNVPIPQSLLTPLGTKV